MFHQLNRYLAVLLAAACLTLTVGCKPKAAKVFGGTEVEAAQNLPEGTNVLAALNQKDYETAVAGLTKIQQSVSGIEQESHLLTLKQHVKEKLIEASDADPKAAEALQALRSLSVGR